jgi:hypothetical protein
MDLGLTQPLIEMNTRNFPLGMGVGEEARPARKADNLTAICETIVLEMYDYRRFTTLWASMTCYRDSFTSLLIQ